MIEPVEHTINGVIRYPDVKIHLKQNLVREELRIANGINDNTNTRDMADQSNAMKKFGSFAQF